MTRPIQPATYDCAVVGSTAPGGCASLSVQPSGTHTHRIMLTSPNGPTVTGRCACGLVREYPSSGDDDLTITIPRRRTYPLKVPR